MEETSQKLQGKLFLENYKILNNQIISGVKEGAYFVAGKTKEGAIYFVEKTKEGASYATEKAKEGAFYVAEKAKSTTDKVYEGTSGVGYYIKSTYDSVKSKIAGEQIQIDQDNKSEISQSMITTATTESLQNSETTNYKEI